MLESSLYLPHYRSAQLAALSNGAVYDPAQRQKQPVKHEKSIVKNPFFPLLVAMAVLLIAHLRNAFLAKKTVAVKKQLSKVTHKVLPPKPLAMPLVTVSEPKKSIAIVAPQLIEPIKQLPLPIIEIKPPDPLLVAVSPPVIKQKKEIPSTLKKAFEPKKPAVPPVLDRTQLISPILLPTLKKTEAKESTVIISPPRITAQKPILQPVVKLTAPQKTSVEAVPVIEIKLPKEQAVVVSAPMIEPKKEIKSPVTKAFEPVKPITVLPAKTQPITPIVVPVPKSTEPVKPIVIVPPSVIAPLKPLKIKLTEPQKPLAKSAPVLELKHPAQSVITTSPVVITLEPEVSIPVVKAPEAQKPLIQPAPETIHIIKPVILPVPKSAKPKEPFVITTAPMIKPAKPVELLILKAAKLDKPIVKALPTIPPVSVKPVVAPILKNTESKKQVALPTYPVTAPAFAIRPIYTMNVAHTENGETQVSYSALPFMSVLQ